jgi:hypothetical protein
VHIRQERARHALPRRQDLPEEAFLSAADVRDLPHGHAGKPGEACGLNCSETYLHCKDAQREPNWVCSAKAWNALTRISCMTDEDYADRPLRIASISHGWLTPEHPDPFGQQLLRFAQQVEKERTPLDPIQVARNNEYYGRKWRFEVEHTGLCCGMIPIVGQPWCTHMYTFPEGEFAVFYDFGSLLQRDAAGERSEEETKSFDEAKETMGVRYGHKLLTTFILSELPEGWPKTEAARPFFPDGWLTGKGWPTSERAMSGLIKRNITSSWRRIVDTSVPFGGASGEGWIGNRRDPPLHPRDFASKLALKVFTNGADTEFVATLYADSFANAFGNAPDLIYQGCGFDDADAKLLAEALPYARRVRRIFIDDNFIGTEGFDALAAAISDGAAPKLRSIFVLAEFQTWTSWTSTSNKGDISKLRRACAARDPPIEVV